MDEEEAGVRVHVRLVATLEVEVELEAVRRDGRHAVDEVAAVHRVGADEVACQVIAEDAVLRIGVTDLVAEPSRELTQEVLRLGKRRIEEERRVDGRVVATQALLELRAVGLPLRVAEERDATRARADSCHSSHREVAVGRDGHNDSVRADTSDGTTTYLYGAEGQTCVAEC